MAGWISAREFPLRVYAITRNPAFAIGMNLLSIADFKTDHRCFRTWPLDVWCSPYQPYLTKDDDPNCSHFIGRPSEIELTALLVVRPTVRRARGPLHVRGKTVTLRMLLMMRDFDL
jgi:hypothetical protein